MPKHFLIIDARFYTDIADELVRGAGAELERRGATFDRISVPGVLEIPGALSMVLESDRADDFDGYVLLGCVIRGETSHYDIVAGESARGLTELAVRHGALIGNGILTTDDGAQARLRADPDGKDKGGAAVAAALALLQLQARWRS